jgi:hypothetical protein
MSDFSHKDWLGWQLEHNHCRKRAHEKMTEQQKLYAKRLLAGAAFLSTLIRPLIWSDCSPYSWDFHFLLAVLAAIPLVTGN